MQLVLSNFIWVIEAMKHQAISCVMTPWIDYWIFLGLALCCVYVPYFLIRGEGARLLAGYIVHPNVAGATVLSLGCQNAQVSMLKEELAKRDPNLQKPVYVFEQQTSTLPFRGTSLMPRRARLR